MNELLNNPVTTMWGPAFLAFYGVLLGIACLWFFVKRSRMDGTRELSFLPIDDNIDPYRIAYLRGGVNEVLRLATVEMFSKKAMVEEKKWLGIRWHVDTNKINQGVLTPIAREVANYFNEPRKPTEMLRSSMAKSFLENSLKQFTDPWDEWIDSEQLRVDSHTVSYYRIQVTLVMGALLALGGLKIVSAVLREHYNILFLVFMMVGGLVALVVLRVPQRLSDRGKRYLQDLQLANVGFKKVGNEYKSEKPTTTTGLDNVAWDVPMMAMGLFGVAALQGSPFDSIHRQFQQSAATGTWGGSGCGSGCGSGPSCGSGCGGGGCGGGCGGCGS